MMGMSIEGQKMHNGKSPMACASGIFGCCLLTLDTLAMNSNTKRIKKFREKIILLLISTKVYKASLKSLWTKLLSLQHRLHNKATLSFYENFTKLGS